jgi:hypothetical protein
MRQLLIGTGATATYASGLLANGAIAAFKKDANGEMVKLNLGDTIVDAPEICFMQGTAAENIVSPWISGKNIINWSGLAYEAQTAKAIRVTVSGTSGSAGAVDIKFIRREEQPQEFHILSTHIPNGTAQNDIVNLIEAQAAADIAAGNWPEWLSTTISNSSSNTVDFTGSKNGDTTVSGATWKEGAVEFVTAIDSTEVLTSTFVESVQTALVKGSGNGYDVERMENELMGSGYGYYNRMHFPKSPANTAVVGTNYDVYSIVATKDGSTSPQIKGVDNLMEIYVAAVAGDTDSALFQDILNAYLLGTFPSITL